MKTRHFFLSISLQLCAFIPFLTIPAIAQVSINTDHSAPDNSAMLDVKSTSSGILVPRMTWAERDAIASPASGLLVLCTNNYQFYANKGTPTSPNWVMVSSQWFQSGNNIWFLTGKVGIGTANPSCRLDVEGDINYTGTLFKNGVPVSTGVAGVYGSSPVQSSGGPLPVISITQANSTTSGFLSSTDWSNFNNKVSSQWVTNAQGIYYTTGKVGIGTSNTSAPAALNVSSTTGGFLPPRMTYSERNSISGPVAGLIIYCTDCGTHGELQVYDGTIWTNMAGTASCGNYTINHLTSGNVAPVNKTVTYGTVTNIPGEPTKCWITSNLGATQQATSLTDATEASAGWYWQFNRKQGYKHDGTTRTPNTAWNGIINESSDWTAATDPCTLEMGSGWRIPTHSEWYNVDNSGGWTDWNSPWYSELHLHTAGALSDNDGALISRGSVGHFWSSNQNSTTNAYSLIFNSSAISPDYPYSKPYGAPLRCLK